MLCAFGRVLLKAIALEKDEIREKARPGRDAVEGFNAEARYLRAAKALLGGTSRAAMLTALQERSAPFVRSPASAHSARSARSVDASEPNEKLQTAVAESVRRARESR